LDTFIAAKAIRVASLPAFFSPPRKTGKFSRTRVLLVFRERRMFSQGTVDSKLPLVPEIITGQSEPATRKNVVTFAGRFALIALVPRSRVMTPRIAQR
jgi:hypothetical protein